MARWAEAPVCCQTVAAPSIPEVAPVSPARSRFAQELPTHCSHVAPRAQLRPDFTQLWPNSGQTRGGFDHCFPHARQPRSESTTCGAFSADTGPMISNHGLLSTNSGRSGQMRFAAQGSVQRNVQRQGISITHRVLTQLSSFISACLPILPSLPSNFVVCGLSCFVLEWLCSLVRLSLNAELSMHLLHLPLMSRMPPVPPLDHALVQFMRRSCVAHTGWSTPDRTDAKSSAILRIRRPRAPGGVYDGLMFWGRAVARAMGSRKSRSRATCALRSSTSSPERPRDRTLSLKAGAPARIGQRASAPCPGRGTSGSASRGSCWSCRGVRSGGRSREIRVGGLKDFGVSVSGGWVAEGMAHTGRAWVALVRS